MLKERMENLPHLRPVLWCGFSPKPGLNLTEVDCYNIIARYIQAINRSVGGHQFAFLVYFPDNDVPSLPNLHFHFVILSDCAIPASIYRAVRRRTYGWFFVKKYDSSLGGIPYCYDKHREMRMGDLFCRNGRRCRHKRVHQEFHDAVNKMYDQCSI